MFILLRLHGVPVLTWNDVFMYVYTMYVHIEGNR